MAENALQIQDQTSQLSRPTTFSPCTFQEALVFAEKLAKSSLVPKDFQGHPENILVAIQHGAEVGLQPLQALNSICVVNGRPALFGDAALAIVKAHRDFESIREEIDENKLVAKCTVKRRNQPEVVQVFSKEDAIQAGLWDKGGPWKQYPKRMLKMRARGFAIRDAFPDALRGIITAEEAQDYQDGPTIDAQPAKSDAKTVIAEEKAPEPAISLQEAAEFYRAYKWSGWTADQSKEFLKENLGIESQDSRQIIAKDYAKAMEWAKTKAPVRKEAEEGFATLGWTKEECQKLLDDHKQNWTEVRDVLSKKVEERDAQER